jgi:competence protein ComFC
MNVMAIGDYQEPLKTLILAKAWSDIVACNQLADLMWQKTYFKNMPCDYLVPVPLHWMRQAKRGYNQAQEIAFGLARKRNVTVESIIARRKSTPFQSSLPHQDRLGNVKDAFVLTAAHYEKYHNKNIVLVDDLMTSGATLAAAAKVLLPLKPASINALVACRVL